MNLKEIRLYAGLTQLEVAQKLGFSQSAYSRFENGKRKYSFEFKIKVAEICEVDIMKVIALSIPMEERQILKKTLTPLTFEEFKKLL